MQQVWGVQFRRRDLVKSNKNLLAQIDTKAAEIDPGAV